MLETALFYTMSTIAQTLAGAMALTAAFIVSRLDGLNRAIYEHMVEVWNEAGLRGDRELDGRRARGDAKAVFQFLQRLHSKEAAGDPKYEERHPRPVAQVREGLLMVDRKEGLLRTVQYALLLSIVAIAHCFLGLMFVPLYGSNPPVAWTILGVAVLLGVACLVAYVHLLMKALRGGS